MKKIIVLILAFVLSLGSLSLIGCTSQEPPKNPTDANAMLFNGFENFDQNVQTIKLLNGFGQVKHNRQASFVKSGECSLELRPNGWAFSTDNPYIVIPTFSTKYEFGYTDFSNVQRISLSVYNAQQTEFKIGVGLTTSNIKTFQWYDNVSRLNADWFTLAPGWNDISYYIEPAYFNMNADFKIDEVYGIFFEFEYVGASKIADTPTVYIDDIYFHNVEGERVSEITPLNKKDTNGDGINDFWEVCDFEDLMQNNFIYVRNNLNTAQFDLPNTNIVSAESYGITAKSGQNVLEITKRSGASNGGMRYVYVETNVMAKVMENVVKDLGKEFAFRGKADQVALTLENELETLELGDKAVSDIVKGTKSVFSDAVKNNVYILDALTGVEQLLVKNGIATQTIEQIISKLSQTIIDYETENANKIDPSEIFIEFDLYNASNVEDSWSIEYYTANGNSAKTWKTTKAQPGQWVTVSCDISTIDRTLENRREKDLVSENPEEKITQEEYDNYQWYVTNPGRVRIGYTSVADNKGIPNVIWLMDNVRVVYKPNPQATAGGAE